MKGVNWSWEGLADVVEGVRKEWGDLGTPGGRRAVNLFRKYFHEFQAGTGEETLLGRGDVCVHPQERLMPGVDGRNGKHQLD